MSDLEDPDLLEEIKALENALAYKAAVRQKEENCVLPQTSYCDENEIKTYHELVPITLDRENEMSMEYVFELNKKLLQSLYNAKEEISALVAECDEKLELVNERLQQHSSSSSRVMVTTAGMPYFKDKNHFAAPKNEIAKTKSLNNELHLIHFHQVSRWTPRDRNILLRAIKHEAIANALTTASDEAQKEPMEHGDDATAVRSFLPRNFYDMIGPLGTKEFDWLKIAVGNFDTRHSAEECRVMWNVHLHPDINKARWTKEEDRALMKIAKDNKFQDWDKIAVQLNTRRSGYQCYVRYYSTQKSMMKSYAWSEEEDRKLFFLIEHLKIGDFIPWGEVANCMYNRTKQQVYYRWMYSLAPHLKKGRFTKEEDKILLKAITEYGTDFTQISETIMPHRSTVQLNDHYRTLIMRRKRKGWELHEDVKLMELYEKIGPDWSRIAKHFSCRNRVQLRHRYASLLRAKKKGIAIYKIPRHNTRKNFTVCARNKNMEEENDDYENYRTNIDKELIMHFCFEPDARKSGRKQTYCNSKNLDEDVKELYKVLRNFDANLNIPHDLSNVDVPEVDKQILSALRNYTEIKNDSERKAVVVEEFRRKMFGNNENLSTESHFIPPLPFNAYTRRKIEMNRTPTIDYRSRVNEKFLFDAPTTMETPEVVTAYLDDSEHEAQFQKFSNFLSITSPKYNQRSIPSTTSTSLLKKLHVVSPNALETCSGNTLLEKLHSFFLSQTGSTISDSDINIFMQDIKEKNLVLRKVGQMIVTSPEETQRSVSQNKTSAEITLPTHNQSAKTSVTSVPSSRKVCKMTNEDVNILKPTRVTLSTFEKLKYMKDLYDKENECSDNVSQIGLESCERAHRLLKERLWKLFKYPLVMDRTFIAEIVSEHGPSQDAEVCVDKKRKTEPRNVAPKKRRKNEKK